MHMLPYHLNLSPSRVDSSITHFVRSISFGFSQKNELPMSQPKARHMKLMMAVRQAILQLAAALSTPVKVVMCMA